MATRSNGAGRAGSSSPAVRRTGYHVVECPGGCDDSSAAMTFQQLERRAPAGRLPRCAECGLELLPIAFDVLFALELTEEQIASSQRAQADTFGELEASILQGQKGALYHSRAAVPGELVRDRSGGRLRPAVEGERISRAGIVLVDAADQAMGRLLEAQRRELDRRRRAGLVQEQRKRAEDMPF